MKNQSKIFLTIVIHTFLMGQWIYDLIITVADSGWYSIYQTVLLDPCVIDLPFSDVLIGIMF